MIPGLVRVPGWRGLRGSQWSDSVGRMDGRTWGAAEVGNFRQVAVGAAAHTAPGCNAAPGRGASGRAFCKGVTVGGVSIASEGGERGRLLAVIECGLRGAESQRSVEVEYGLHSCQAGLVLLA